MRLIRCALFLLCGLGCGAPRATTAAEPRAGTSEGEALYTQYCALCHGAEGQGYAADNATRLNGQGFLRTVTDEFLSRAIARGRADTAMAPYHQELGGPLTQAQIDVLVQHIRAWQEGEPIDVHGLEVRGDADRGEDLFREHCADCHGPIGEGDTAQSLSDYGFLVTASDGFLRYAIEHGREGTPMPAFGNRLEAQQIDDLVALMRRWEEEPDEVPEELAPPSIESLQIIRHPNGPRPRFTLRDDRFVSAAQVRDAVANDSRIILLDARPTSEWLRRRIPGAIPVPYYEMEPMIARLPRDGTWMIAYCGCPHAASGHVVDALRAAGFENTAVLDEGVHYWINEGFPTESGPARSP